MQSALIKKKIFSEIQCLKQNNNYIPHTLYCAGTLIIAISNIIGI